MAHVWPLLVAQAPEVPELRSILQRLVEKVRLRRRNEELLRENVDLRRQFDKRYGFEGILGHSPQMSRVFEILAQVSPTNATVLILGESGTGKELLARLIHRESGDPDAPFIAVNLAAIPRELAESTLFGHERGAFTGAHRQQLGKFELASNGTLFLDEIGDLRLDLQAKLLRAIQEGEIERVGGAKPIKTEFRLIAAWCSRTARPPTMQGARCPGFGTVSATAPPPRAPLTRQDLSRPDLLRGNRCGRAGVSAWITRGGVSLRPPIRRVRS